MGETPQIQVCQACSILPKKTLGVSKGSEYLRKCDCFFCFFTFAKMTKNLFFICHYGVLCVDWWEEKMI
jgi:hypothetical protein